jgi:hypothetical protein
MENSCFYTLFFQKNNIMLFKNRFNITANRPLPAILRSFVQTPLIIVWATLTLITFSFLPHFLLPNLWHKLHEPAKPKHFQWLSHIWGGISFGYYVDIFLLQPFQRVVAYA